VTIFLNETAASDRVSRCAANASRHLDRKSERRASTVAQLASLPPLYSTCWAGEMAPVRRCFRSGDAAFVALLATTALVSVQSYSLGSVFGGSILLRLKTSAFCQGPTCLKPAVPSPSLRARTNRGMFALQTSKPTSSAAPHSSFKV